ncbi:hypothetical protein BC827DRAFT_1186507 [Russula dissimulans]|nr:hypothetical protein BC827DRAFT_1186507 [Russula dissimulans]
MDMILAATPKPISPSTVAVMMAGNCRVASMAVAAYEYLITLPAEFRLYKSSKLRSPGSILFFLIRYSSVAAIIMTNINFFDHHFSSESCARYSYVGPIFKVIQVMVSQAILGIRAYQIAEHRVWVGSVLIPMYIAVVTVSYYRPLPHDDCLTANARPDYVISAWTFYLVAMLFDCLALSISTIYLLKKKPSAMPQSRASKLLKIMLYDGLGYFVALTAVNLVNIVIFRGGNLVTSTAGTSLAYVITLIMGQRILLHPREAQMKGKPVIVQLPTVSPLSPGVGRAHSTRSDATGSTTVGPQDKFYKPPSERMTDIEVCVEESIITDTNDGIAYTPRSGWDRAPGHHV